MATEVFEVHLWSQIIHSFIECGIEPIQFNLSRASVRLNDPLNHCNSLFSERVSMLLIEKEKKEKKLRRQRKLSLHQLRKERHIGSKSRESPSPVDERGINVDQVGFCQHAAPGHQSNEWAWGFLASGMGSADSLTYTLEDWVDSNLCTFELFAQFTMLLFGGL
eukprot:1154062-Pelagomonas_calceolata.AAC.8